MEGVLFPAFVYLCAALVAVPLAERSGLGSVLGYLAAGVMIGPVLGLAGAETRSLQSIAELGVVMMLFLVGLELEPRLLWRMRGQLAGLGGLQVLLTCLAFAGLGRAFGLAWGAALTTGMILAMSSTAIVLQTLKEKGYLRTQGGQASFAVLLFQDIAVIPILALIPLLAVAGAHTGADAEHGSTSLVAGLPGWAAALATLAAVAFLVIGGQYLARPLFRFIARARLREVFTAAALAVVIGNALLMSAVGLSPALGAFLAGVVLATSEFRHELESDIEPFKGLLLGLFFITVGAGIDFGALFAAPVTIVGLTLGLIAVKALVLWGLGTAFRLRGPDRPLFALGLAQAGEFGFVLISFSQQAGAIDAGLGGTLSLAVTLSMLATPLLFLAYERIALRAQPSVDERDSDEITEQGTVIIAGLGRFGQVVNRILLSSGYRTVVLDHQAEHVDEMRRFGVRGFYGDATRPDLLHAAGLAEARVLVVAIDDPERTLELVKFARRARPDIHIVVRAFDRVAVYALFQAGANDIIREVFDSSVRAGRCALEGLGNHPYRAQKLVEAHVRFDRESMRMLAEVWKPGISVYENAEYIRLATQRNAELERTMMADRGREPTALDRAWTPPPPPESQPERQSRREPQRTPRSTASSRSARLNPIARQRDCAGPAASFARRSVAGIGAGEIPVGTHLGLPRNQPPACSDDRQRPFPRRRMRVRALFHWSQPFRSGTIETPGSGDADAVETPARYATYCLQAFDFFRFARRGIRWPFFSTRAPAFTTGRRARESRWSRCTDRQVPAPSGELSSAASAGGSG